MNPDEHPNENENLKENPTHNDELLIQDCLPYLTNMPDRSVAAVITDPPYPNGQGLFTDQLTDGLIGLYLATKKAKNYVVFFWTPNSDPPRPPAGWWHTATHIWHKPDAKSITPYEAIIVWGREYRRTQRKVWTIPILDYRTLKDWKPHPTQKPIRLLRNLIELYTKEGETVLDPFAGTGTTAVACKHTRRHYLMIEKNPEYASYAQQRLQERIERQDALERQPTEKEPGRDAPSTDPTGGRA